MLSVSPPDLADKTERTLIVVKPDGVQRRLVGQIIQRFERRGFKMVGLKMLQVQTSQMKLFAHVRHSFAHFPTVAAFAVTGA